MKAKLSAFSILFVSAAAAFAADSFWPGKTMEASDVAAKWGKQVFESKKFSAGDSNARASMAFDLLLKQSQFVGKSMADIKASLGDFDGHYFNDWIPAYIIEEGHSKNEDTWQIVFLPDKSHHVAKIIVHKNCCN
jgi:hypothetical protein